MDRGTSPNQQEEISVVVFFSAHHRGYYYTELEEAIARMSEQLWAYTTRRKTALAVWESGFDERSRLATS